MLSIHLQVHYVRAFSLSGNIIEDDHSQDDFLPPRDGRSREERARL